MIRRIIVIIFILTVSITFYAFGDDLSHKGVTMIDIKPDWEPPTDETEYKIELDDDTDMIITSAIESPEEYYQLKDEITLRLCGHDLKMTKEDLLKLPKEEIIDLFNIVVSGVVRIYYKTVFSEYPGLLGDYRKLECEEIEELVPMTMIELRKEKR